jgi:hypothetical protein
VEPKSGIRASPSSNYATPSFSPINAPTDKGKAHTEIRRNNFLPSQASFAMSIVRRQTKAATHIRRVERGCTVASFFDAKRYSEPT